MYSYLIFVFVSAVCCHIFKFLLLLYFVFIMSFLLRLFSESSVNNAMCFVEDRNPLSDILFR